MSYSQLIVVGNVGRDIELRYTPSGQAVADISVAVSRKWNSSEGVANEETTWFRCTAWGRTAEIASQYLAKGRQVMIVGRLRPDEATGGPRVYEKQDGTFGASFEVHVDRLVLLGSGGGNAGASTEPVADFE